MKNGVATVDRSTGEIVSLDVPGELTRVGWVLPDNLTEEQFIDAGRALKGAEGAMLWWIGDWAAKGDERYGKLKDLAEQVEFEYQTVADAQWVAKSTELSRRRESLPWSFHKEVAALEPEQADELLDEAEPAPGGKKPRLTRNELRAKVKALKAISVEPIPLPAGVYSVILADPPWRYDFAPTDSRKIENQYPTMDVGEICALNVPAADDSVLFMWATAPKLTEAMQVMDAWGFRYVTHAIWDKEIIGMGYWFRGQHELVLVGVRGEFSPPPESDRIPSVIRSRRARHSEKPDSIHELIEKSWPNLSESSRLEMFARRKREGWTLWGNQAN